MELDKEILDLRPYLFSIAYNMLGVVEEAEDIVQDIYEKWMSATGVKEPKAYLGRMVVNRSIDRLGELKQSRAAYTGPWLPEPYITFEPDPVPTLEYGMLFLLERLNPNERAVFLLRESFSEAYEAIAMLTGLSEENCRQLLHRAHRKLGRNSLYEPDPAKQRALTEAFLFALQREDRSALETILREDIELQSDGGGKRAAALKPLAGLQKVVKFLLGIASLPESRNDTFEYRPAFVNGVPAALLFRRDDGSLDSMQYVSVEGDRVARLLFMRNPDKLRVR